jgi:hypothetical protein
MGDGVVARAHEQGREVFILAQVGENLRPGNATGTGEILAGGRGLQRIAERLGGAVLRGAGLLGGRAGILGGGIRPTDAETAATPTPRTDRRDATVCGIATSVGSSTALDIGFSLFFV